MSDSSQINDANAPLAEALASAGAVAASSTAPAADAPAAASSAPVALPAGLNHRLRELTAVIAADMRAIKEGRHTESEQINANFSALSAEISALIEDSATGAGSTWSSAQIKAFVADELSKALGSVGPALITLSSLSTAEGADAAAIQGILAQVSAALRFDEVQTLTATQALQARENIGAVSAADVGAAITAAFTDEDLAAGYAAASAPTSPSATPPATPAPAAS
jgi:hypothetical protein